MKKFFICLLFIYTLSFANESSNQIKKELKLEDRFNCQKKIEKIYWAHRIWPQENLEPKPALQSVMPDEVIKNKVEDYLKKSNALEYYWRMPIKSEQLQAEMERMAKNTKQPLVLEEIFNALNNDPYLIAECLARQILVERLIRNWYAFDERFHGELKRKAEEDLIQWSDVNQMNLMSGDYFEREYVLSNRETEQFFIEDGRKVQIIQKEEEWIKLKNNIKKALGKDNKKISQLQEDKNSFYLYGILEEERNRIRVATVEWKKKAFDEWWKEEGEKFPSTCIEIIEKKYTLPSINYDSRVGDSWQPTSLGTPSARADHTAVWTGSEMIIWGGCGGWDVGYLNTGGIYSFLKWKKFGRN